MTACIQLKRQGLRPLLIEKNRLGGALPNANLVENYPGFPEGIDGNKLTERIITQFETYGIETLFSEVKSIDNGNNEFEIKLDNDIIQARSVIVATGAVPKRLGLKNEGKLYKSGRLFYELKGLSPGIREKVVIIGSGDAAFDCALNLSDEGNHVTLLCRKRLKCLPLLKKRVENENNIKILRNESIHAMKRSDTGVELLCDRGEKVGGDYILVAVGKRSNTGILNVEPERNKRIFVIGDANHKKQRQLSIAVGEAVSAAMEIGDHHGSN